MPTRAAAVLALSVLLAACSEEPEEARCACEYPAHCAGDVCTTDCAKDAECGDDTLVCAAGSCTSRCRGVICADGMYCEATSGDCVPDEDRACSDDEDCDDETLRCEERVCISRCAGVACNDEAGELCHPRTGECVGGRACETNADCRGDATCEEGLCAGNRLAGCNPDRPCAKGLSCIGNVGYTICAAPCDTPTGCRTNERCILDEEDDAGAYAGYCIFNLCRPGGGPLGLYQDVPYMGACDSAGEGDGLCVGPLPGENDFGFCFGRGTAVAGTPCHADAAPGSSEACASGICAGAEATGVGTCLDGCSLFDGVDCPDLLGMRTACFPVLGPNGVCVPQADPPGRARDACRPAEFQAPCEEDLACLPGTLGPECTVLCSLAAEAGDPGACAEGTCTERGGNRHLGVCEP